MRSLMLPALALLSACELPFGQECTTIAVPAISVAVLDSISGQPLVSGATVWVRDGEFTDTLQSWSGANGVHVGAHERSGNYQVRVSHPEYLEWRRDDVRVRDGGCHVVTQELTARLVPRT